jgi:hypothetical protein
VCRDYAACILNARLSLRVRKQMNEDLTPGWLRRSHKSATSVWASARKTENRGRRCRRPEEGIRHDPATRAPAGPASRSASLFLSELLRRRKKRNALRSTQGVALNSPPPRHCSSFVPTIGLTVKNGNMRTSQTWVGRKITDEKRPNLRQRSGPLRRYASLRFASRSRDYLASAVLRNSNNC